MFSIGYSFHSPLYQASDDLAAAREQENLASRIERQEALTELVAACADVELPIDDEDETAPGEVE